VQGVYDEIRQLGGEVLAVSFTPPERVAAFVQRHPLPFPAVADPERRAYRAFGLERTSWRRLLSPLSLAGYLWLTLRGWLPWKAQQGADVLQLGGDFVLDGRRRLVYAYRSVRPTDRPAARELLAAIREAVALY
jgi:peroxiredoxin